MKLNHPGLLVMPATQYHAEKAIGHSGIVKMLKSPAHLREYLDHPHQPTPAMAFGTAVHTYVLEQDRFAEEFVVAEKFAADSVATCVFVNAPSCDGAMVIGPRRRTGGGVPVATTRLFCIVRRLRNCKKCWI